MIWPFTKRTPAAPKSTEAEAPRMQYSQSSLAPSQLIEFAQETGDVWPYLLALRESNTQFQRDTVISYGPLFRCVSLISGVIAQLLADGPVRVVDRDKRRVTGYRQRSLLDLVTESPDGGLTASSAWWEDYVSDLLLDGNAIAAPYWAPGAQPRAMGWVRMSPWDADITGWESREPIYRLREAHGSASAEEYLPAREVIHSRWGQMRRAAYSSYGRTGFASSPVVILRPAMEVGIQADRYVAQYFRRGNQGGGVRSQMAVTYDQMLTGKQLRDVKEQIERQMSDRGPMIIGGGGRAQPIKETPADGETGDLREYQVQELGRIYGVPPPLLGTNVTQWGSGIEQLARLFYRFGLRQHIMRVLAPFNLRLLPRGQRVEIDETQLLRGDMTQLATLIAATVGDAQRKAILRQDELRSLLGVPPHEGPEDDRPAVMPVIGPGGPPAGDDAPQSNEATEGDEDAEAGPMPPNGAGMNGGAPAAP